MGNAHHCATILSFGKRTRVPVRVVSMKKNFNWSMSMNTVLKSVIVRSLHTDLGRRACYKAQQYAPLILPVEPDRDELIGFHKFIFLGERPRSWNRRRLHLLLVGGCEIGFPLLNKSTVCFNETMTRDSVGLRIGTETGDGVLSDRGP